MHHRTYRLIPSLNLNFLPNNFFVAQVDPRIAAAAASSAMTEFCRIKEEVPAALLDSHVRTVATHVAGGGSASDGSAGLDKTGIAGTTTQEDEAKEKEAAAAKDSAEKKDAPEKMEVDEEKEDEKPAAAEKKTEGETGSEKKSDETGKTEGSESATKTETEENGEDSKSKSEEASKEESGNKETPAEEEADEGKRAAVEKLRKDASVQQAAAAALGAAAVKAKHLAAVEERKIKSLVALLVETQMKKLEIKLRHFEELETIMDRERESLELQRQQLLQEQQQFHLEQLKAAELRARQHALHQLHQQQQQQQQQTATIGSPSAVPAVAPNATPPASAAPPAATIVSH